MPLGDRHLQRQFSRGPITGQIICVTFSAPGTALVIDPAFKWSNAFGAARLMKVVANTTAMTGTTLAIDTTAGAVLGATAIASNAGKVFGPATSDVVFSGASATRDMALNDVLTLTIAHGTSFANLVLTAYIWVKDFPILDEAND